MPRYWASLERAVSNEKAPASAQFFGKSVGTDSPAWDVWLPDHATPVCAQQNCCEFVTLAANRNQLVRPAQLVSDRIHLFATTRKGDFGIFLDLRLDRRVPKNSTKSEYFQIPAFRTQVECGAAGAFSERQCAYA